MDQKQKIIQCLEFYAKTGNYSQCVAMGYELASNIELDNGERARQLLLELEKQTANVD